MSAALPVDADGSHACPNCGSLSPCGPLLCPESHTCGDCGKVWVRYTMAPLGGWV